MLVSLFLIAPNVRAISEPQRPKISAPALSQSFVALGTAGTTLLRPPSSTTLNQPNNHSTLITELVAHSPPVWHKLQIEAALPFLPGSSRRIFLTCRGYYEGHPITVPHIPVYFLISRQGERSSDNITPDFDKKSPRGTSYHHYFFMRSCRKEMCLP